MVRMSSFKRKIKANGYQVIYPFELYKQITMQKLSLEH